MIHLGDFLLSIHREFLSDDVFDRAHLNYLAKFAHRSPNFERDRYRIRPQIFDNPESDKFDHVRLRNQLRLAAVRNSACRNPINFQSVDR
jgi:hypothetical protein